MQQKTSDFLENFSTGLKYARLALGLTQAELAESLGVTQTVVSNWESRQNGPGRKVANVAAFFAVHIDPATGQWKSIPETSRMQPVLQPQMAMERPPAAKFDVTRLSWLFKDFTTVELVRRAICVLDDSDTPDLLERARRARVFLDEIERRAEPSSAVDAAAQSLGSEAVSGVRQPVKYRLTTKAPSPTGQSGEPADAAPKQ